MESNMLENSLIHLLDAVNRLDDPMSDKNSINYAVVHLWRGIMLLLKKRLLDEHWTLFYKSLDDSDHQKENLPFGGFTPVNFIELKNRLLDCCGIDLSEYINILNKIRKDYKKIELRQFVGSKDQIRSNLVKIWPFIVDFISKHVDLSNDTFSRNMYNQTCEVMDSHLKYIHHRKNEVTKALQNQLKESYYAKPLRCPECLQKAIPLLSNKKYYMECYFCGHVIHWKEYVFKHQSESLFLGPFHCLDCTYKGVIQTEDGWICLSCLQAWKLERINVCRSCENELVWATQIVQYCKQCKDL